MFTCNFYECKHFKRDRSLNEGAMGNKIHFKRHRSPIGGAMGNKILIIVDDTSNMCVSLLKYL